MAKEINISPDAIRLAARDISNLDLQVSWHNFSDGLQMAEGYSEGLVANQIDRIITELVAIECLVKEIANGLPHKLDSVAKTIEDYDNAAADQFK